MFDKLFDVVYLALPKVIYRARGMQAFTLAKTAAVAAAFVSSDFTEATAAALDERCPNLRMPKMATACSPRLSIPMTVTAAPRRASGGDTE